MRSIRDLVTARPGAVWRTPGEICPLSSGEVLDSLPTRILDLESVRIGDAYFVPVDLPTADAAPILVLVEDDDEDVSLAAVLQSFDVDQFVAANGQVSSVNCLLELLTLRQLAAPVECTLARIAGLDRLLIADDRGCPLLAALEVDDGPTEAAAIAAALRDVTIDKASEIGGSAWESNPPRNASVRPHDRFEDGAPHRRSRTPASV
jgi:hypothetical protein